MLPACRQTIVGPDSGGNLIRAHASATVRRHAHDPVAAQAEQPQRLEQRRMGLLAHDDRDRRRAEQAIGLDVPAGARQHDVARRRERGEVRHRRAGDERALGAAAAGRARRAASAARPPRLARHPESLSRGTRSGPMRRPASWPPVPRAATRRSRSRRSVARPSPSWPARPLRRAARVRLPGRSGSLAMAHRGGRAAGPQRDRAVPVAARASGDRWRTAARRRPATSASRHSSREVRRRSSRILSAGATMPAGTCMDRSSQSDRNPRRCVRAAVARARRARRRTGRCNRRRTRRR